MRHPHLVLCRPWRVLHGWALEMWKGELTEYMRTAHTASYKNIETISDWRPNMEIDD